MRRPARQKLLQALSYLPLIVLGWRYGPSLEGTEFSAGKLTGPLLQMNDSGAALLIVALVLVWFFPRVAAIVSLAATLLCLPLFLYFTVPGVYYRVFNNLEFSVPLRTFVNWDRWAVLGIIFSMATFYINSHGFFRGVSERPV